MTETIERQATIHETAESALLAWLRDGGRVVECTLGDVSEYVVASTAHAGRRHWLASLEQRGVLAVRTLNKDALHQAVAEAAEARRRGAEDTESP